MNLWMRDLARKEPTPQESFESSISETAYQELEKSAGEFSEYLDGLLEQKSATPHLDRLKQQTKLAQQMGRELAHKEAMDKEAGIAGSVMSALKPMASKALGFAAKNPTAAMGIGGAALGAAGGAVAGGPGNRMSGALKGGVMGGAAGYGATKLPGSGQYAQGLAQQGLAKLAFSAAGLGRMGAGAALGGIAGAIHKSQGEKAGLESGHHLRNALVGAAGGAALGAGSKQIGKALVGAEHAAAPAMGSAAAHAAPSTTNAVTRVAQGAPQGAASSGANRFAGMFSPEVESRQAERVKNMANSMDARRAAAARGQDAMVQYAQANPTIAGVKGPTAALEARAKMQGGQFNSPPSVMEKIKAMPAQPQPMAMANTMAASPAASKKAPHAAVHAALARMNQSPAMGATKMAGAAFIKMAFSMSAQAEPGTPSGAQEPEAEAQFQSRPSSKPAVELYGALKHLSPKTMRGLQAAQPGT